MNKKLAEQNLTDWNKVERNGLRVEDVIQETLDRVKYLNEVLPCYENECVIYHLERAIHWEECRNKRRKVQGLQGTMKRHTY